MGAKQKQKERDNPSQREDVLLEDAVEDYCSKHGFSVIRGRSFPDLILENLQVWIEVKNFRLSSKFTEPEYVRVSSYVDGRVISSLEPIARKIDDDHRIMERIREDVGGKPVPEGVHLFVLINSPPAFKVEEFEDRFLREFLISLDREVLIRFNDRLPEELPANVSGMILWEGGRPRGYRNVAVWDDVPESVVRAFNFDDHQHQ